MSKAAYFSFIIITLLTPNLLPDNAAAADTPTTSDFINELPVLQPSPYIDGVYFWIAPGVSSSEYDRFIIDEIDIFIHPESTYQGVNVIDFLAMTSALRSHLIDAFEPRYPVVNKPGPGILRMRIAITGVKLEKRDDLFKREWSKLFIGQAMNRSREPKVNLHEASMEMELLDSSTGKRFGVAIDPEALRKGKGKMPQWEAISESFKLYANRIRQRLDEERKK